MEGHTLLNAVLLTAQIIFLDVILSGDNAIVIAMTVAGLPKANRRIALVLGMSGAIIFRIAFCFLVVKLYTVQALQGLGGIALLWIATTLFIDFIHPSPENKKPKDLTSCLLCTILAILAADLSMSIDNILAISALAKNHIWAMGLGLLISIALLAFAAERIAGFIDRWRWLKGVGAIVIAILGVDMIGHCALGFGVIHAPGLVKLFG